MKTVSASIEKTTFNCPHCGVFTHHYWHSTHSRRLQTNQTPILYRSIDDLPRFEAVILSEKSGNPEIDRLRNGLLSKRPFLKLTRTTTEFVVGNLFLSKCYSCDELSVWAFDRMVWPSVGPVPPPNPDLPQEIRDDYNESSSILTLSPRGSAALLRLCVQKLCIELGGKGKSIDSDIAALVKRGLDVRVKAALDIVRVIGNNAVHPGIMDIKDDIGTATTLFGLVNLIADIMISQPKNLSTIYDTLPEGARAAIARRDGEEK